MLVVYLTHFRHFFLQGDDDSVLLSRDLLDQFMKKMLEFDFRNGPLRRKFDGLKYALKLVEDLVFEGAMLAAEEVASKRLRRTEVVLVPVGDIDSIRIKMDDFDAKREDVIKRSRDLQKLSKQGIYSVQRGDIAEAELKLAASKRIAEELLSTIIQTVHASIFYKYYILICILLVLSNQHCGMEPLVTLWKSGRRGSYYYIGQNTRALQGASKLG